MTTTEPLARAAEAEEIAYCLLDFAAGLRNQSPDSDPRPLSWPRAQLGLAGKVEKLLMLRQQRTQHLDASLFGEPAWDILLNLMHANLTQSELTLERVGKLCDLNIVTSLRWVNVLERYSLVIIEPISNSTSSDIVRITDLGILKMIRFITNCE